MVLQHCYSLPSSLCNFQHPSQSVHVQMLHMQRVTRHRSCSLPNEPHWLDCATRFSRDDLVETVVAPNAAEAAATVLRDTEDDTARVVKYLQRYQEVQRHRLAMQVRTSFCVHM